MKYALKRHVCWFWKSKLIACVLVFLFSAVIFAGFGENSVGVVWQQVKANDNLIKILVKNNILQANIKLIAGASSGKNTKYVQLQPNDIIELIKTTEHELITLRIYRYRGDVVEFNLNNNSFERKVYLLKQRVEPIPRYGEFVIKKSLFVDGLASGLSYAVLLKLQEICSWEFDINRLRVGDRVALLYDTYQLPYDYSIFGAIVDVSVITKKGVFRATRYETPTGKFGYFQSNGKTVSQSILRYPLSHFYISSPFSYNRKHPVLDAIRPHKGVDLAANRGTPIWATGSGTIAFVGVKGGYGRVVIVQHNAHFSTVYAHMEKFAFGIKKGVAVHQKQIIGYVGNSGLANGYHLHYEFRIDGKPRDPIHIKLPNIGALMPVELDLFKQHQAKIDQTIYRLKHPNV